MKDILPFSVPGSESIHELQLGLTLIRFAEFDLAYFRDQCVGLYRKGTPDDFMDKAPHLKEYLHSCHPYCKAALNTEFDKIVLDCVITDICAREEIGLEGLWSKYMAAPDRFGQAVFLRVTEYKTGRAINQWINLHRMQNYAVSKMSFIYGGGGEDQSVHKALKLYYDLAFSVTAAELGYQSGDLPSASLSSVPFLPLSGTVMKTAVGIITPAVKELTKETGKRTPLTGGECVRDQMAGLVLKSMAALRPPENEEIALMARNYGALPGTVYTPTGLKAIIDLEFDQLAQKGFYIKIYGNDRVRMKYSVKRDLPGRQQPAAAVPEPVRAEKPREEDVKRLPGEKAAAKAKKLPDANKTEASRAEVPPAQVPIADKGNRTDAGSISDAAEMGKGRTGKVGMIISMAENPSRASSQGRSLQEINMRCNMIWTSMNVQTGWSITPEDASEWFRYLTRLRYGIGIGEMAPEDLDKFLDATLEVYRLMPGNPLQ